LLFGRAIRLDPQNPTILTNASRLLFLRGEINSAVYIAERAVDAASDKVVPYGNLAKLLQKTHNLRDSLAVLSQALSLPMPARSRAGLHQLRGNLFLTRAQHAEAIAEYRRAADLAPETTSALAMARTYCDDATAAELGHLHRAAAAQLLQVVSGRARTVWHNGRDPNRKLRIGIVSADLVHHPVGLILASWLRHVDRQQFDVFCYHISPRKDEITARLASAVSDWRDAVGLDTAEIADMVESDSIDILMDVGGYTEGSPLAIFALKPAPLQLSWAGYIFSSGLTKIDGIIHDRYTAPPALDRHYTEEIIRLGCMPYCYDPQEPPPPVAPTPALARGYVTFGSFNNPSKLTDRTLSLWTAVLRAVPLSRLLLKSGAFADPETVQMFCDRFERLGIGRDRLQFAGGSYFTDYLRAYDEVDIALDPLPFNGGITSLQGLWQGVPVLSRCGELYAGRVGGAIMHALSLSSWVTESDEQFVRAALVNTADFASLNRLRQQMRDRLRACTIGNGRLFARRMEQLWRNKWYEHCRR
jgi:predicted O-linked N-acetylglucosamine transferase (SPINDLY family)